MDNQIIDKKGLNCHEIETAMHMIDLLFILDLLLFIHANKQQLLKLQEYYDNKLEERCNNENVFT